MTELEFTGKTVDEALFKGLTSAGMTLKSSVHQDNVGVLVSVSKQDLFEIVSLAKKLDDLKFRIYAPTETADAIVRLGIDVVRVEGIAPGTDTFRLLEDGAATQKQMDDIAAQISVLEKQISARKSSLGNSVSSLDAQGAGIMMQIAQIDDQLSKCRIISPVSGTVLTKYSEAGEFAAAGRPLFKVADLDRVYLRAYLTSAQLAGVRLGQEVKVYSDYGRDSRKEYRGVIAWISPASEFTPKNIQTADERKNLVYAIKVGVVNDGLIKLGMYGGIVF